MPDSSDDNKNDSRMNELMKELPGLYQVVSDFLVPLWKHMVSIVVDNGDPPGVILDLCSGPGQPGLMLAEKFPACSKVILSDKLPAMLDTQRKAVEQKNLQNRVEVQQLDMNDLSSIPDASVDLVTCSLGLHLNPNGPAGVIAEIQRILVPGGRLVASIWEDAPAMDIEIETMKNVTGKAPTLPFDPKATSGGRMDPICQAEGFSPGHSHNVIAPVEFHLGPVHGNFAFRIGMTMFLAKLLEDNKIKEAKEAFIQNGGKYGKINNKGELIVTQYYRIISMTKS